MALTYSITGGVDAACFTLGATSGVLAWKAKPDFEKPLDADKNNIYLVEVGASDGVNTTKQTLTLTVTDMPDENLPPQITSPATKTVQENSALEIMTITATDPDGGSTIPPPAGKPGPTNTGVPAGTTLVAASPFSTNANGQVIEAKKIGGILDVRHRDVKVRKCEINNILAHDGDCSGLVIEDTTIKGGSHNSGISAVSGSNITVQRCNISGVENGMWGEVPGLKFLSNWVHHPAAPGNPDPHYDGLQIPSGSNAQVIGNNFDLAQGGTSSCMTINNNSNLVARGNWIDGGSFCVYFEGGDSGCLMDQNEFISYYYGWVSGVTWQQQSYTNNKFAGVLVPNGVPSTTRTAESDKNSPPASKKGKGPDGALKKR